MISHITIVKQFEIEAAKTKDRPGSNQITNGQPDGQRTNRALILLWLSLVLIVVGDLGAYLVQTDGGKIEVSGFKLPTENGQWITADLFRPKTATKENPVPVVVVCPGFERSKETMTSYSIELARRGIAVITIDPYGQGASSSTQQKRSATVEGYGVVPMVEYICGTSNLNYINKSQIGAAGYSAGGNAVLLSAARFGARQARALRDAQAGDSADGSNATAAEVTLARSENKLSSIFIGGYVLTMTNTILAKVDANVGLDYAYYDEGAYRTENGNAHMRDAPEALRLVNSILDKDEQISEVEIGKVYGDPANQTLRVVHNTKNIHPLLPYDPRHVANLINFFTTVFRINPPMTAANQIWPFKEFFTLMALAGAFLFLVPCATLLLRLPGFKLLVHPVPPALPMPGRNGKILFWITFVFSAAVACFLFIPMVRATTGLFPQASAGNQTWLFPQRINNAILLWAVANGIVGLIQFAVSYQLVGKKHGSTPTLQGIKTSVKELGKTLCLASALFAAFYAMLFASYAIFHADFRFTFVSAAASFPPKMLLVALEYIPLFFIFYLANSIRVNCASRFEGQKEWVSLLICALGNSAGLMMILVIQYLCFAATGRVYWTQEWLYTNLLLGVIPMMFVLPCFNRYFFRITGRVYLGPMVTCLIFIMMMLTGNVCYIPLK